MFPQRELAKIGLFIPRFLMGSSIRSKLKYLANSVPYWERDRFNIKTAVQPWAFLRVHNEINTIHQSLSSISTIIHKGVIASHGSTDGTDEYIHDFVRKNPGFIFFKYPYEVVPANDPRYQGKIPYKNTLAAYYEATLDLIPEDEWLIKIDADMIYFPELLEKTFHMISSDNDCIIYSRLNLIRTRDNLWKAARYERPGDHWLIKNNNLKFINKVFFSNGLFRAHEVLIKGPKRLIAPECSCLHFPYEKQWRRDYLHDGINEKELHDIQDFIKSLPSWEFDPTIYNKKNIEKIANKIFQLRL